MHFDESLRDFRTGWAYLSHPQGYGFDPVPTWARWMLMNPDPASTISPIVVIAAFAFAVMLLVAAWAKGKFSLRAQRSEAQSDFWSALMPSALFVVSLLAVVVTIIVSPGDPRVAVVHSTASRVWAILGFASIISALVSYVQGKIRSNAVRPLQGADGRDG